VFEFNLSLYGFAISRPPRNDMMALGELRVRTWFRDVEDLEIRKDLVQVDGEIQIRIDSLRKRIEPSRLIPQSESLDV
jgi:hypothetical protein